MLSGNGKVFSNFPSSGIIIKKCEKYATYFRYPLLTFMERESLERTHRPPQQD